MSGLKFLLVTVSGPLLVEVDAVRRQDLTILWSVGEKPIEVTPANAVLSDVADYAVAA